MSSSVFIVSDPEGFSCLFLSICLAHALLILLLNYYHDALTHLGDTRYVVVQLS